MNSEPYTTLSYRWLSDGSLKKLTLNELHLFKASKAITSLSKTFQDAIIISYDDICGLILFALFRKEMGAKIEYTSRP
jgi:hypothetical protein